MKIRKFNEELIVPRGSSTGDVVVLIRTYSYGDVCDVEAFRSMEKAADRYMDLINQEYKTEFELTVAKDGVRNYHSYTDNPSYVRAMEFMDDIIQGFGKRDLFFLYQTEIK